MTLLTISRVLNHPDLVSPETRERVYEVMRENQYTPNWFARNLTQKQTRTIAFIYPSNDSTFLQAVADGVEIVALNKKNLVFLCHTNGTAEMEQEYLEREVYDSWVTEAAEKRDQCLAGELSYKSKPPVQPVV